MSSYSDFANSASDILLTEGDAQARAKARSGELWGSTISTLGQQIPQQVQQAIQVGAQKRKTAQIQAVIQQSGGDLDQALPQIMGIDAMIGAHLAEEHAKVQKSVADVQKIKQDAAKAQLDIADRLWSGVTDEGSYARAALFAHRLGEQVPDQYDPAWVTQKKESLLSLKDQLDANKPIVVPRGGTLATPKGEVLAKGEPFPAPQPTEAAIALQAVGGDPAAAMDRLKPPPSITPYQTEELKMREKEFGISQQRLALAIKQSNKPAIAKESGKLADAVMANPELWGQLTATQKGQIAPQLQALGFTDFKKPVSATVENRLASAQAVQQTGNDIISQLRDPKVAALVGPAMGRVNSLRDFIGNPPPELSDLAGSIESYALANMGVHGMRSVEGSEHIKRLLDQKHTPESLIRTIQGLNRFSQHFLQNEDPKRLAAPAPAQTPVGGVLSYQDYLKSKGGK